jgi:hypothetical protein
MPHLVTLPQRGLWVMPTPAKFGGWFRLIFPPDVLCVLQPKFRPLIRGPYEGSVALDQPTRYVNHASNHRNPERDLCR